MAQMTGLNYKIQEMAHRIRELREIENFTIAEMAMKTGVTEQEYIDCELGRSDLNFAFLYRCALALLPSATGSRNRCTSRRPTARKPKRKTSS